jgi:hypothetical protein
LRGLPEGESLREEPLRDDSLREQSLREESLREESLGEASLRGESLRFELNPGPKSKRTSKHLNSRITCTDVTNMNGYGL